MIQICIQIPVGQFLMNLLLNTAAADQLLNLISGSRIRFLYEVSDNIVAACIHPVILRHRCISIPKIIAVIDHIPWAVYICISKLIAVIPFLNEVIFLHKSIVIQHPSNFFIRKTKILVITYIFHRIHFKIIQSCKDTFFRYSQASRKNCTIQAAVRLKRLPKQSPDKLHHGIIIAGPICLIERHIIFIDQNDRFLFKMLI